MGVLPIVWLAGCSLIVPGPDSFRYSSDGEILADAGAVDAGPADSGRLGADASIDSGPECMPVGDEVCNGLDDDCDTRVDEEPTDATTSDDCGSCGVRCGVQCTSDRVCENFVQVEAGRRFSCGLTTLGRVLCWGINSSGQLGRGAAGGQETSPVEVPGISAVTTIAVGDSHACALLADNRVLCWGSNARNQIGNRVSGGIVPAPTEVLRQFGALGDAGSIRELRAHGDLTCAIVGAAVAASSLYCWGDNRFGQIGSSSGGVPSEAPIDRATQVSSLLQLITAAPGVAHACAVTASAGLSCWGDGSMLGDGVTDHGASCSGRDCSLAQVVPGQDAAVAIFSGDGVSCSRSGDGSVSCWEAGQPPAPRTDLRGVLSLSLRVSRFTPVSCGVADSGGVSCWGDNSWGALGTSAPATTAVAVPVDGISAAVQVSTGETHVCATTTEGLGYCWGSDRAGELGDGELAHGMTCRPAPGMPAEDCSSTPQRVVATN